MRIAVVTQYFWPESFRINDVVEGLRSRGHELLVLTGRPNYPHGELFPGYGPLKPARELFGDVPVVRVPMVTRGKSRNWRLALNYLTFASSATLLGAPRCEGRFDAVLVYEPSPVTVALPGLALGRLKHAPVLMWIQDLWPETLEAVGVRRDGFAARVAARISHFVHSRCDVLLAQSRAYEARLTARGIPAGRIEYMPNWADDAVRPLARESVADPMAEIRGFRIVFAGNIGSAQSFETIVEAAARVRSERNLHWVIVGDGNMREWLDGEIRRRDLQGTVHTLGWRSPETMPAHFAHADALLVTLRSDLIFGLTVPSKVQAYLAAARPILAALNGEGAAILNESGAALVGPAEDADVLAQHALELFRADAAERDRMGLSARAYFEANFRREPLLTRLEASIERAIRQRANPDTRR